MTEFVFSVVVTRDDCPADDAAYSEWGLDITEALAEQTGGKPDMEINGHSRGLLLEFYREANSFSEAIASAFADIEAVGLRP